MDVVRLPGPCPTSPDGCAVTIGAYDGVHLGHRAVIATVRERAAERGLPTTVVTFDRHPAMVVRPETAPRLLTDLEQKLELLEDTGVERVVVIHFDEQRASEEAADFVDEVLVGQLGTRLVVVGDDFHFGRGRRGNVALLREMGEREGFEVAGLDLVGADGLPAAADTDRVSSTAIRHLLTAGSLDQANAWLGRPHEVRGVVKPGDKRGRALGFPTANVSVPGDILLPADGIYAGWYERPDGTVHPTALSLGRRPTFYQEAHASLLECYLLDFDGDLYEEPAHVRFVARLRGERRFESVEALVAQMDLDVREARKRLDHP
jgi:riboflavin kinase/FMN adenylyltransferase